MGGAYDKLLSGKKPSPIFPPMPEKPSPSMPSNHSVHPQSDRTEIRSDERSENRPLPFPPKRRTKRYSFEFFEDQIIQLKQLKYQAEAQGRQVYLSELAREAMDQYLEKVGNA